MAIATRQRVDRSSGGQPAARHDGSFVVPALPARYVDRPRLTHALERATASPVTIVTAPRGTGKTTAFAVLARNRAPESIAWCTLPAHDASANNFGALVLRAILRTRASAGADARRVTSAHLLDQAHQIAAAGPPLLLVLDDVDALRSRRARAALQHFVHNAPAALSIVLCSRRDPDVHTEHVALRAADIAFTNDESTQLMAAFDARVTAREVATVTEWTAGSAGALALAAVALRDGPMRSRVLAEAERSEHAVNDYVTRIALDSQPEPLRSFILETAIVDAVDRDLATAITGAGDAHERLATLARDQLFLTAHDGRPGWYRHHALFADLLRATLTHEAPERVARLHRRAARWYAGTDHEAAARHAVAGGDWDLVVALVNEHWTEAVLTGTNDPINVHARTVPAALAGQNAAYALTAAIARLEEGDRVAAVAHLAAADELGARDDDGTATLHAVIRVALAMEIIGAGPEIDAAADELVRCRNRGTHDPVRALQLDALVLLARGKSRFREGDLAAACDHVEHAIDTLAETGWTALSASATARLALMTALRGRVRAATALNDELGEFWATATSRIARSGRDLTLAICAYHADDLPAARRHLADARARLLPGVSRDVVAPAVAARLALCDGDGAAAERHLAAAEAANCPALLGVACESLGLPHANPRGALDPGSAHPYALVQRELQRAYELASLGAIDDALASVARALAAVDRHGYRRAFVDAPVPTRALLEAYTADVRPFRMIATQLLDRMRPERPDAARCVEHLTERELTVLRHLPSMMSNSEIAAEMYFSVNTVKTHLKSIYRKLGVTRRRDAVERAQELNLI